MTESELWAHFQEMEDNLNDAYEKNDTEIIFALLADDWVILEPSTGLSGKEQFLHAIKAGKLTHSRMKKEIVQVRSYNDFAIVITRGRNEGHYLNTPFGSEQWVTNIYKKIDQQWICVMTQEAAVTCQ